MFCSLPPCLLASLPPAIPREWQPAVRAAGTMLLRAHLHTPPAHSTLHTVFPPFCLSMLLVLPYFFISTFLISRQYSSVPEEPLYPAPHGAASKGIFNAQKAGHCVSVQHYTAPAHSTYNTLKFIAGYRLFSPILIGSIHHTKNRSMKGRGFFLSVFLSVYCAARPPGGAPASRSNCRQEIIDPGQQGA